MFLEFRQGRSGIRVTERVQGVDLVKEERIEPMGEPKPFEQPTANVGMSSTATIPTAPYASVKIEVSLHLPCYVNEVDATYEFVKKWVDDKMDELTKRIDVG